MAAICSTTAAAQYGLEILERSIQDSQPNLTRFIVLSRSASPYTQTVTACSGPHPVLTEVLSKLPGLQLARLQQLASCPPLQGMMSTQAASSAQQQTAEPASMPLTLLNPTS